MKYIHEVDFVNINSIPISIINVIKEDKYKHKRIIFYKGKPIITEISDIYTPEVNKIGDIQIVENDLGETLYSYNEDNVNCYVSSCKPKCKAPMSKITQVIKNHKNLIESYSHLSYNYINSIKAMETKKYFRSSISLMIVNVDFKRLLIKKGSCNLNFRTSQSCSSCKIRPHAIFVANNIKDEGYIKFNSNCSFDVNYLSCNKEPYTIELLDENRICLKYSYI